MKEVVLSVGGMTCNKCVEALEKGLSKIPGIDRSLVDLEKEQAFVEYNDEKVNEELIKEIIHDLGYEVKESHTRA
jgi:copper ion binding protein